MLVPLDTNTSIWQFIHSIYFYAQWQCCMYGSIEISGRMSPLFTSPSLLHSFVCRSSHKITDILCISISVSTQFCKAKRLNIYRPTFEQFWNFRNFHLKFIQTEVVSMLDSGIHRHTYNHPLTKIHTFIRKIMLIYANSSVYVCCDSFCICQIIWRKDWNFSSFHKCLSFRGLSFSLLALVCPSFNLVNMYIYLNCEIESIRF